MLEVIHLITDKEKLKEISKKIHNLVKKIKDPDLNLKINHPEIKDLIITFRKNRKRMSSH